MPRYHISGIIQVTVSAPNARAAVNKALARQDQLMKSPTLNVSLDNISDTKSHNTVDFDNAEELDVEDNCVSCGKLPAVRGGLCHRCQHGPHVVEENCHHA